MELLPIQQTLEENTQFLHHPDCESSLSMSVEFFNRIGYTPPWIGYYAQLNGNLVGSGAFKGKPKDGRVEIAYGILPHYQQQGICTELCRQLVILALKTDPAVKVTARTFLPDNPSTRILKKNGFVCSGTVWDDEDGTVWEWEYTQ
ncbi:GNAT family N-acetyltransferase [Spirosoma flavum]|uniref:GNAT family N-acetyltransferase n=1 Tax=Spirosoma flavum TaxID=2048557 RepID=A0ABW6AC85_9BACT